MDCHGAVVWQLNEKMDSLTMNEEAVRSKLNEVTKGLSEAIKQEIINSEKF